MAGNKGFINPDVPCVEQLLDAYSAYAVTRAMSKKKSSDEDTDVDLADTSMTQVFEKAVGEGEDKTSVVGKEARS